MGKRLNCARGFWNPRATWSQAALQLRSQRWRDHLPTREDVYHPYDNCRRGLIGLAWVTGQRLQLSRVHVNVWVPRPEVSVNVSLITLF